MFPEQSPRELIPAEDAILHLKQTLLYLDLDGDGYTPITGDCDNWNNSIHPGAQDIPDDGIDQDCSGTDAGVCNGITCGEYGICVAGQSGVSCDCDEGYTPIGLVCVEDSGENVFDPNPCLEPHKTVCLSEGDIFVCFCDDGYVSNPSGDCILQEDPVLKSLLIYPTAPYSGYMMGELMYCPDQLYVNQLKVMAIYSDESSEPVFHDPVEWSCDNLDAATISSTGLLVSE